MVGTAGAALLAGCAYRARTAATAAEAAVAASPATLVSESGEGGGGDAAAAERPRWRLYTMAGLWGLPTFDPACLKIQAYMRFLHPNTPWFETDASGATHVTPERTLPVVMHLESGDFEAGAEAIVRRLATEEGSAPAATIGTHPYPPSTPTHPARPGQDG